MNPVSLRFVWLHCKQKHMFFFWCFWLGSCSTAVCCPPVVSTLIQTELCNLYNLHAVKIRIKLLMFTFHNTLYCIHVTDAFVQRLAHWEQFGLSVLETHGQDDPGIEPPYDQQPTSSTTWATASSGIPIAYLFIYPLLSLIWFGNTNVFTCHAKKANSNWEKDSWRSESHDMADNLTR